MLINRALRSRLSLGESFSVLGSRVDVSVWGLNRKCRVIVGLLGFSDERLK